MSGFKIDLIPEDEGPKNNDTKQGQKIPTGQLGQKIKAATSGSDASAKVDPKGGEVLQQTSQITEDSLVRPGGNESASNNNSSYDEFEDEFIEDDVDKEVSRGEKYVKEKSGQLKLTKNFQITLVVICLAALVIVIYQAKGGMSLFPKKSSDDTFDKIEAASASGQPSQDNNKSQPADTKQQSQQPLTVDQVKEKLQNTFKKYQVELAADGSKFLVSGNNDKGFYTAEYDLQGKMITEGIIPKTEQKAVNGEAAADDSKITIEKSDYMKTLLPMKIQKIAPSAEKPKSSKIKYIISYEKLPLKGRMPYIFGRIDETGEDLLFPVTIEEYTSLPDKGSTVIEVNRVISRGVETYENVTLVKWRSNPPTTSSK